VEVNQMYKTNPTRIRTISEIIFFVELMEIEELPGWDDINFKNIRTLKKRKDLSDDELLVLLESLRKFREIQRYETNKSEYLEEHAYEGEDIDLHEVNEEPLDIIAMINKYMSNNIEANKQLDESWRKLTPKIIKFKIKDWNSAPIERVYEQAKTIMENSTGRERGTILPFVVELSQIIFDNQEEIGISQDYTRDEINDLIMSRVEMIILPHLEMLDIISQRQGEIPFTQFDDVPLTDTIKEQVLVRDGQKCVLCGVRTDLHVQHKIPLDTGGINHQANLVTLCSPCGEAIKTADVQYAFKRCTANYDEQHNLGSQEPLSSDIEELKEEVEKILDGLATELENMKKSKLTNDVMDVKKRLEIIFHA